MANSIICKTGAIDSINKFSTAPTDKTQADVVGEVKRALHLSRQALIDCEKKALSFKLRYQKGKKGQRRDVTREWNENEAFRFLGSAPQKNTDYTAVHRRFRKLVDRMESTDIIVRPHSGVGSGHCSSNANSLGYMSKLG